MSSSHRSTFDLVAASVAFEACELEIKQTGRLSVGTWQKAMAELLKVFDAFGAGLAMAFSDIINKVDVLEAYAKANPSGSVEDALKRDVSSGNKVPNDKGGDFGKCSVSRALNRCAYVSTFVREIFSEMQKPGVAFQDAVRAAYDLTLSKIHGWVVRGTVSAAFSVALPDREGFLKAAYVNEADLPHGTDTAGDRMVGALRSVAGHVQAEFDNNGLSWEF